MQRHVPKVKLRKIAAPKRAATTPKKSNGCSKCGKRNS